MDFKTINNMDFTGKKVIMRADLDVPLDESGNITDDIRLKSAVPTIQKLLEKSASQIIIMGHMGRPDGQVKNELKLDPCANRLSELLNIPITKLDDCINIEIPTPEKAKIVMLENLRFHNEETDCDLEFAKTLASYADIYVNESFAVSHRNHASFTGITQFIPGCAGLTLEKELNIITGSIANPEKPFVAIMGGAKVSGKIKVIDHLIDKVDHLLIGGAMMFTFIRSQGHEIGKSLCEIDKLDLTKNLLNNDHGHKLIIPKDTIVSGSIKEPVDVETCTIDQIPADKYGLDIGPQTIDEFKSILRNAKTIIWNGPMGLFEIDEFAKGTNEIALFLSELSAKNCKVIVGGGDSDAALKKLHIEDKIYHVSTGGGASLILMEGEELIGVTALKENMKKFG